ncbi:MAG: phage tail protein [Gammaproteobacteria bacterium]
MCPFLELDAKLALDCTGVAGLRGPGAEPRGDFQEVPYGRYPHGATLQRLCEEHMDCVSIYGPGDVLLMAWEAEPQHLRIASDVGIIHSYAKARAVVEHALDPAWRARIRGTYRFRGLEQSKPERHGWPGGASSSGGAGGGTQISYTYSVSFAIGLCEGPIVGVRRIWADSKLIYNIGSGVSAETLAASQDLAQGIRVYIGSAPQELELLAEVHVQYFDLDNDYLPGSQYARRLTTASRNQISIDLPLVLSSAQRRPGGRRADAQCLGGAPPLRLCPHPQVRPSRSLGQHNRAHGAGLGLVRLTRTDYGAPGCSPARLWLADDTVLLQLQRGR